MAETVTGALYPGSLELDPIVLEALEGVFEYASDAAAWITVKKELLRALPPAARTAFSTRDPVTKKQRTNDFELRVIAAWRALGGRDLLLMQ